METWIYTLANRYFLKKYHKELKENAKINPQINESNLIALKASEKIISKFELMDAIEQLENKRERLLILLTIKGFETEEIAKKMEISKNNVYILRTRAIKKLRNLFNV